MVPTVPEMETPFRTTTPSAPAMTAKQVYSVYVHALPAKYFTEWTSSTLCTCPQAAKIGFQTRRLVSLEKSPAPAQWKDFCEQTPIDKARHSGCFEGIGYFPGEPYKYHLKPEHKPARHAPR